MRKNVWSEKELQLLRDSYGSISIAEIAKIIGRSRAAVRNKAYELRITSDAKWSHEEVEELKRAYAGAESNQELALECLSWRLGRTKVAICIKARKLGLTDIARKGVQERKVRRKYHTVEERSAATSKRVKEFWKNNPHPKGMTGKRHTPKTKAAISSASKRQWDTMTSAEREQRVELMVKANRAGSPKVARGTWKAGWREIGGQRCYFRSRWEANYARWLEALRARGSIVSWEFEPETFWFDGIKRGVRSYKPDFRVKYSDGRHEWHEVKGYMDARSKTTLKRMAKYHPEETIVLVREADMRKIWKEHGQSLEGWENANRSGQP